MKREIKFRGKVKESNRWIIGSYNQKHQTITWDEGNRNEFFVNEDTVGQYTGFTDKNKKEIYEKDIVKVPMLDPIFTDTILSDCFENAVIEFSNGSFIVNYRNGWRKIYLQDLVDNIEVIGNIFDNQDLLIDN